MKQQRSHELPTEERYMREYKYRAFFEGKMLRNAVRIRNALYWNDGKGFDLFAFKQENPAILMEYSTLRDTKNTEIYEDDIVAKFDFEDPYYRSVVVRHLGAFGYYDEDSGFIAFASNYHFNWVNGKSDEIVVIGSIYENYELIKGKR